jgi:putative transcriptional regulator
MTKRNIFDELKEGFDALAEQRKDKLTLRTHTVRHQATPTMTSEEVAAVRTKLNLSQAVFADCLRTSKRTVEGWEQGRAKPNAQAVLLIKLVEKYPETVGRLATV